MTINDYIKRNTLPDGRMPLNWMAHWRMLRQRAARQAPTQPKEAQR